MTLTDEEMIEHLQNIIDDLKEEVRQLNSRAENAETLADKYRSALDDIRYNAQEALR